jgi:putative acyl-CoA dehydrogenase
MRAAQAVDRADADEHEALLGRFLVPLAKFWVCRRTPPLIAGLLETFGGNGYVEAGLAARLYPESPLNGIWEGSGNVICLDLFRVIRREPGVRDALRREIRMSGSRLLARLWNEIDRLIGEVASQDRGARRLAEEIAIALQYALLLRHAAEAVAEGFRASKVDGRHLTLGAVKPTAALREIIERATLN